MTRRRWIADQWTETTATLSGEQAQHLARVLRAEPGMVADVVAAERVFRATITAVTPQAVTFALHEEIDRDQPLPVTLFMAIFKFDRMEWAIEKSTELGVSAILPVIARRTEKHLAQAAEKRVERWRRIAQEATQQSRRSTTPEILSPETLTAALNQHSVQNSEHYPILLSENESQTTLAQRLSQPAAEPSLPLSVAVGPEGGWAAEELALFATKGWHAASLGPRILRAETASIAALAMIAALLPPAAHQQPSSSPPLA